MYESHQEPQVITEDDCICIFAVVIKFLIELNTMRMKSSHSQNIKSYYTFILRSLFCITASIKRQQYQNKKKSCLKDEGKWIKLAVMLSLGNLLLCFCLLICVVSLKLVFKQMLSHQA